MTFSISLACGGDLFGERGVIKTPNYPDNYYDNEVCQWVIHAPDNETVDLKFTEFEVEFARDCDFDYLEIR